MASIRGLKKQIDSRLYEVIADCFTFSTLHPDKKSDEVTGIISDAVNFRNELMLRVNNSAPGNDPKGIRDHYKMISNDIDKGVDKLFERLSSLSKTKKK